MRIYPSSFKLWGTLGVVLTGGDFAPDHSPAYDPLTGVWVLLRPLVVTRMLRERLSPV